MENKNKFKQKTFKQEVMKTKNNVQKAVLRSVAVVVSFVLISFSVSGQNFWEKLIVNSGFDQIALAMVSSPDNTEFTTSTDYSMYRTETEEELSLENWMMDEAIFGANASYLEEAVDSELEVEEWMTNEAIFEIEQSEEEALELEDWMTDAQTWSI